MNFQIFGPFEIPRDDFGIANSLSKFWKVIDTKHHGLPKARGCYLFGIRTSGSSRILPWYIGKTNNQSFDAECFKPHQRVHYGRALNHYWKSTPQLFLIAQLSKSGKFQKGAEVSSIDFLETYLIGAALSINKGLLNKRDTKLYREVVVPGILNSKRGNPGRSVAELKRAFYLDLAKQA